MRGFLLTLAIFVVAVPVEGQPSANPDTVDVRSGALQLRALLWRPDGLGPFPAILFNHGSGRAPQLGAEDRPPSRRRDPRARPDILGPLFARHGYVFLVPFRRGQGLSADQGISSTDSLLRERATRGADAENRLQVRLLETDQLDDALAALALLRTLPEVDARRVAVVGHSYGGSLTLLLAERDSSLRAAVDFAGASNSWGRSPQLRARLLAAVRRTQVPTFFIHAANDYSVAPARAMAAEMARLRKSHRVKIYPRFGRTPDEGHSFVYLAASTWEAEVFAFLSDHMRR